MPGIWFKIIQEEGQIGRDVDWNKIDFELVVVETGDG